ncbi:MAG: A/G-specific adenine glycosylase [Thaumarchaeota archaeon]|nr:A/G-specific adenine glycosylase [Candidatus Geocrenenecus arthurdayi]
MAPLLLKRTTIRQVARIYEEFMRRFPTPHALLSAGEEDVKKIIKPLGLHNKRSKELIELARVLVDKFNGEVPCDKEKLRELPGVGEYIVSEVLLRACRKPEPLLDINMTRVVERIFSVKSAKKNPYKDPVLWSFAKMIVPKDPDLAEKFHFGILDLARKICRARDPRCDICPMKDLCSYYANSVRGRKVSTALSSY